MRIYVASSWRNPWQPETVRVLRALGHEVYDFRAPDEPGGTEGGFSWREIDPAWRTWKPDVYRAALDHPLATHGFGRDFGAMKWADGCVMVVPCGRSAALELGWCAGAGKRTAVLYPFGINAPSGSAGLKEHGHTLSRHGGPCASCGDLDGCHKPGELDSVEPELMNRLADAILLNADELRSWVNRS